MQTHHIVETTDIMTPAQHTAARIGSHLGAGKTVLWLVSGGSAIKVAVLAQALLGGLDKSYQLQVALIDERFGEQGHSDSNAEQLTRAGFDTNSLTFHQVLTGRAIDTTTTAYDATIRALISRANVVIGLFGMGSDGHTAGLLPGNPLMDSNSFVGQFDGPDYQRITVTPALIAHVGEAILYAVGSNKWPVLADLMTTELPISCLRQVPSLTVFSDYKRSQS